MGANQRARQAFVRRRSRARIAVAMSCAIAAAIVIVVIVFSVGSRGGGAQASTGTVDATDASVGRIFPDFTMTGLDGKQITKESLSGKKSIVWFTDSTCVPCQLGAVKVRQFEESVGGEPLHVFAVFANTRELPSTLTSWRYTYGRADWRMALDARNALTQTVQLQYLDTKFLLDEHGKILDITSRPVDENYLNLLREKVGH
jgi:thiol-disulfide isomerase/thioredoxin